MKENKILNYYCTWANQVLSSDGTTTTGRNSLDHERLFGENGWCKTLYPEARSSLIFLLDDGWELPYSGGDGQIHTRYYGSQRIFEDKFPNYGETPAERLKTMVDNIKACGWAGAGIWICASEEASVAETLEEDVWSEEYWVERLNWSKYAGVSYWKIDWGRFLYNQKWRRYISDLAAKICPDMIIEHTDPEHPINDIFKSGRLTEEKLKANIECLSYSDVYRTYDVTDAMSVASTFDRVGEMLCSALPQENDSLGILNCEDELYMGVSLGLAIGVMRYPGIPEEKSMDEVVRAVNFQKIAPAFPAYGSKNIMSDEWLEDSWFFRDGETWKPEAYGHIIMQCAPAYIARNTEPPVVVSEQEKPFVSVCKNPNGVFSVATYPRTTPIIARNYYMADITAFAENADTIGIFGKYKNLTLVFNELSEQIKVVASDLLSDEFTDITEKVQISDNKIVISGELIDKIGLSAATAGDPGLPGMLLKIVK